MFVPSLTLVVWFPSVVWFAAVAAPVGSGSDAADTATVLFGETATTSAGSVAIAAVDAAFTAAVFVPSLTLVVWFPSVVWFAAVAAPVGSGSDAADTGCVVVPVGSIRTGCAAVPKTFVPSVISTGHAPASAAAVPWLLVILPVTASDARVEPPGVITTLVVMEAPPVMLETRARTAKKPLTDATHSPLPVVVVTDAPPATGVAESANQLVLSIVASNDSVIVPATEATLNPTVDWPPSVSVTVRSTH